MVRVRLGLVLGLQRGLVPRRFKFTVRVSDHRRRADVRAQAPEASLPVSYSRADDGVERLQCLVTDGRHRKQGTSSYPHLEIRTRTCHVFICAVLFVHSIYVSVLMPSVL